LAAGNSIVLNFSAAVEYESSSFTLNVDSEPDKPLTPLSLFGLMAGQNGFRIFLLLYNSTSTVAFKGFNTGLDFNNGLTITSVSSFIGSNGAWTLLIILLFSSLMLIGSLLIRELPIHKVYISVLT
jgi:hypothetical protein